MTVYPCVKINLGLNVLRKREDGYHDLETLFVPSDEYHDVLEIISGDDYSTTSAHLFSTYGPSAYGSCAGLSVSVPSALVQAISPDGKLMITIAKRDGVDWDPLKDLCARAYFLLDRDFSLPPVKIFLEKMSPVGAGLGGGSADAAFTIRELDRMFSLGLDEEAMTSYAASLGSDCPFFIRNKPVFATGIGNLFEPVELSLKGYHLCLVKPDVAVSTAEAYALVKPARPAVSLKTIIQKPVSEWREAMVNDFEASVFPKHPVIRQIKEQLYEAGALYAAMSGSGSSVFGLFDQPTDLRDRFRGCFVWEGAL